MGSLAIRATVGVLGAALPVGVRLGSDYTRRLTENTEYRNVTALDCNFDESGERRGDMPSSTPCSRRLS